jgi:large subunit ribosomal protein L21
MNFEANMFAVIKSGGKQYRVAKNDIITVEKLLGEPGDTIALDTVLMLGEDGKAPTVGAPLVDKAAVFAEVVEQSRADKIIVFKKQRRQNHRRKNGHRQQQTVLRILEVSPTGAKPKAAAKKAAPKKAADKDDKPAIKKAAPKKAAPKKAASDTDAKPVAKKKAPVKKAASKDAAKDKE